MGGYDQNYRILTNNFSKYKVESFVRLFPHHLKFDSAEDVKKLIKTGSLSALIHDADGRIDRDFYLFWELLIDGGLIIIDDYEDAGKYLEISDKFPFGGMKNVVTFRLVNQFEKWGLMQIQEVVGNTVFAIKPTGSSFASLDLKKCQQIVDEVEVERREFVGH